MKERDEAFDKLVQYRRHVKRARQAMETAMAKEREDKEEQARVVAMLKDKLIESEKHLALLQQTYHNTSLEGNNDKARIDQLERELAPLRDENDMLKKTQRQLQSRLRSLAQMERRQGL